MAETWLCVQCSVQKVSCRRRVNYELRQKASMMPHSLPTLLLWSSACRSVAFPTPAAARSQSGWIWLKPMQPMQAAPDVLRQLKACSPSGSMLESAAATAVDAYAEH